MLQNIFLYFRDTFHTFALKIEYDELQGFFYNNTNSQNINTT